MWRFQLKKNLGGTAFREGPWLCLQWSPWADPGIFQRSHMGGGLGTEVPQWGSGAKPPWGIWGTLSPQKLKQNVYCSNYNVNDDMADSFVA